MLRRKSSRSTHRRPLGRSKSTSSVVRRRAEPTERDAYIAANLSYYRAHGYHGQATWGNSPIEEAHGLPLRRSNSVNGPLEGPADSIPTRKQSVRFTGPNARPRRQLAARAKPVVRSNRWQGSTGTPGGRDSEHLSLGTSSCQHLVETPYKSRASNSSVICPSGYYLTEPVTLSSVPPFLGYLPKSKSTYTQSMISVQEYDNDNIPAGKPSPLPTRPSAEQSQNQQNEIKRYCIRRSLRAPKSMSYLDFQTTKTLAAGTESKHSDYFLDERTVHSKGSFSHLKSHSSMFFRSKHRQQESSLGLSGSLRDSSDNSAALSPVFSGNILPAAKHTGLRLTARRVSRTVRNKLSRLFGRSKSMDTSGNEMRVDPTHDTDSDSFHHGSGSDTSPIEEASMSRVHSHVPSIHAVPSYQQMRSRQGSLESIQHEESIPPDAKSRVTSWSNSTANTVTSYGANDEHEYQRLSVIKENGTHIPSSSHPVPQRGWNIPLASPAVPGMTVNSQRVYSALMKKLTNTPDQGKERQNHDSTDQLSDESVPFRQSSLDRACPPPWSPPIIRCVSTSDDDVFEDTKEVASLKTLDEEQDIGDDESVCQRSEKPVYKAYPNATAGDGKGLSPDKIPLPDSTSKKTSNHAGRNSAFSPTSDSYLFRASSPYRRAIQRSMKEYQESDHTHAIDTRYLSTLSALSLPTRRPSTVGSERDMRLTYAESFYSFTTEELTVVHPEGTASPPSAGVQHIVAADGTVAAEPPAKVKTTVHGSDVSTACSMEWKTWLSANVSKLETPHDVMKPQYIGQSSNDLLSAGHIRESAEIESPGETPKTAATSTGDYLPADVISPCSIGTRTSSAKTGSPFKLAEQTRGTRGLNRRDNLRIPVSPLASHIPQRRTGHCSTCIPKVDGDTAQTSAECPPGLLKMRSLNTVPTATSQPQLQDGLLWKQYDQENSRHGSMTQSKSTPGLAAATQRTTSGKGGSAEKLGTDVSTSPRTPEGSVAVPNDVSETSKSEWDAQIRGSRRMVDLFLSSRRKAIQGTMSRNGSENFSTAFV
ncbi:hypothetical protein ED733_002638 [Metarhizium rileyi]|uniref:Uncharacterized protein n=1 Tax=Metarhizium rileyi (strain RCEF 4871) TaxID=1649241 RepID=A0A5C6GAU0_METRR|nr:hypothetical protein ED733_002638 [Metarhizium rileyi]